MSQERADTRPPESRSVIVDCFPSAALKYADGYAIVAVDVIRATTTAITAVASGRRCCIAPTVDAAFEIARELDNPLLAGEIGGNMPVGFEMDNSPAVMAERPDVQRPVILVTSSGSLLIHNAAQSRHGYLACFRNIMPTVRHLAARYHRVAVIGAGSRAEFREEDQLCCAQIASGLMACGYAPGNEQTSQLVERWMHAPPDAWLASNSVRFLRSTGQGRDLEFILAHRSDVNEAYRVDGYEVRAVGLAAARRQEQEDRNRRVAVSGGGA